MSFSSIAVRQNGQEIVADWFNALRQAGIDLESLVGPIPETQFTLANNQSSPANITGLLISPASSGGFIIEYRIYRNTTGGGATELAEQGQLVGTFSPVANSWEMTSGVNVGNAGVTMTITAAGQVQYTSTNITGTPASSYIRYKARTTGL